MKWSPFKLETRQLVKEKSYTYQELHRTQVPREKMACSQPTEISRNQRLGSIILCHVWRLPGWKLLKMSKRMAKKGDAKNQAIV